MKTIVLNDGTTYTLSPHAEKRMVDREISAEMIVDVIEAPDKTSKDLGGNAKYFRVITTAKGEVKPLIVIVDELVGKIVTVMEDSEYR